MKRNRFVQKQRRPKKRFCSECGKVLTRARHRKVCKECYYKDKRVKLPLPPLRPAEESLLNQILRRQENMQQIAEALAGPLRRELNYETE